MADTGSTDKSSKKLLFEEQQGGVTKTRAPVFSPGSKQDNGKRTSFENSGRTPTQDALAGKKTIQTKKENGLPDLNQGFKWLKEKATEVGGEAEKQLTGALDSMKTVLSPTKPKEEKNEAAGQVLGFMEEMLEANNRTS